MDVDRSNDIGSAMSLHPVSALSAISAVIRHDASGAQYEAARERG
jgi:hypothetical protein